MQIIHNVIKDTSPSQEQSQSSSTPAKAPEMSSIFERVLDAFKLNMQPIHDVMKDTSPSQEHPNLHQLQQKLYKCHQSWRGFLMPSNSSDFNEID